MAYFVVRRAQGPAWDHTRPRREQAGWREHARFMDRLADSGVVVLGGPVGAGDGTDAVLVFEAYDEWAVRAVLSADPWDGTLLTTASVEPWTILLRAPAAGAVLAG